VEGGRLGKLAFLEDDRRLLPFHQGVLTSRTPAGGRCGEGHRGVLSASSPSRPPTAPVRLSSYKQAPIGK